MTRHEVTAKVTSHMIKVISAFVLAFVICLAPTRDAADDDKARLHAEQQAKAAAQPDTWAGLDRDGRRMVAFDRIKK